MPVGNVLNVSMCSISKWSSWQSDPKLKLNVKDNNSLTAVSSLFVPFWIRVSYEVDLTNNKIPVSYDYSDSKFPDINDYLNRRNYSKSRQSASSNYSNSGYSSRNETRTTNILLQSNVCEFVINKISHLQVI